MESLGEFEFLNVKGNPKGWNDSRFEKLWLYNLHYFDYLATMGDMECEEIIEKWIRDNPVGCGNGWEPYPISLRVVNWVKYFMRRGRSPRPTERESLEAQVRWLRSRLEYHLLANHLLANAKAAIERSLLGVDCVLRQELESSYLGFIVIRPLQKTFVGRTCLVPLRDDSSRHFKALCRIQVSFFGLAMTVACMPFQEQDTAVAACATCALWSAFFVTSSIFRHPVLTPGQITELATGHGLSLARRFPNSGLSIMDVAFAIRRAELSPLCICVKQAGHVERMFRKSIILTNIRAYLELGVPLLLFGDVLDDSGRVNGAHALVVNGYHMGGIAITL